jgi:chromosome partitioning protein
MILTLHTAKGGEGKTTAASNLAAVFARAGDLGVADRNLKVLLVGLDSQGCLARVFGIPREEIEPSLAPVFAGELAVEDVIRDTYLAPELSIITCGRGMKTILKRMHHDPGASQRLRLALDAVREDFDLVVVDCAPALGLPFEMAMAAADAYVVPLSLDFLGVEGVRTMFDELQEEWEQHRFGCQLLGIAIQKADYRLGRHERLEAALREFYGQAIFDTTIRINTHVEEAQARGISVVDYAREIGRPSRGAQGFVALAGEILGRAIRRGLLPASLRSTLPDPGDALLAVPA